MTQPTTQAIQQADAFAGEIAEAISGHALFEFYLSEGEQASLLEDIQTEAQRVILQALSVSASEREALEARVGVLQAALQQIAEGAPDENPELSPQHSYGNGDDVFSDGETTEHFRLATIARDALERSKAEIPWISIRDGQIVGTPFGPEVANGKYVKFAPLNSETRVALNGATRP